MQRSANSLLTPKSSSIRGNRTGMENRLKRFVSGKNTAHQMSNTSNAKTSLNRSSICSEICKANKPPIRMKRTDMNQSHHVDNGPNGGLKRKFSSRSVAEDSPVSKFKR